MSTQNAPQIERLINAMENQEKRYQTLERRIRWLGSLLVLTLCIGLFLGLNQMSTAQAQLSNNLYAQIGQSLQEVELAERDRFNVAEHKAEDDFGQMIKRLRYDMTQAGRIDPDHAMAVILHDIKENLETVPTMAADMRQINIKMSTLPLMATQLEQMNMRVGVMTNDINNTMGRAGNFMNYLPMMIR